MAEQLRYCPQTLNYGLSLNKKPEVLKPLPVDVQAIKKHGLAKDCLLIHQNVPKLCKYVVSFSLKREEPATRRMLLPARQEIQSQYY